MCEASKATSKEGAGAPRSAEAGTSGGAVARLRLLASGRCSAQQVRASWPAFALLCIFVAIAVEPFVSPAFSMPSVELPPQWGMLHEEPEQSRPYVRAPRPLNASPTHTVRMSVAPPHACARRSRRTSPRSC